MSSIAISAAASAALPTLGMRGHGHKKPALAGSDSGGAATQAGSTAAGSSQNLFTNLLSTVEQVVGLKLGGITTAVSALKSVTGTAPATATAGAAADTGAVAPVAAKQAQDLQAFTHSLLAALKADGLGSPAGTGGGASIAASNGVTPAGGTIAGGYQGSLVSSLQTLIQQLGAGGATTAATADLSASFKNLEQSSNINMGTAATAGSNAGLQNLLSGFVQSLQANGHHPPSLVGNTVNASV